MTRNMPSWATKGDGDSTGGKSRRENRAAKQGLVRSVSQEQAASSVEETEKNKLIRVLAAQQTFRVVS